MIQVINKAFILRNISVSLFSNRNPKTNKHISENKEKECWNLIFFSQIFGISPFFRVENDKTWAIKRMRYEQRPLA